MEIVLVTIARSYSSFLIRTRLQFNISKEDQIFGNTKNNSDPLLVHHLVPPGHGPIGSGFGFFAETDNTQSTSSGSQSSKVFERLISKSF